MPPLSCIYCLQSFDPEKGEGDHILPVMFGEFRNANRFRRACPDCNNKIGAFEEQLIRCGPEAVHLRALDPALPRRRDRGYRSNVGARGAPAPRHYVVLEDHELPVRAIDGISRGVTADDDVLCIKLKSGQEESIKLVPTITEEGLRQKLKPFLSNGIESVHLHAGVEVFEQYVDLIKRISPSCTMTRLPDTPAEPTDVTIKTHIRVTPLYFQAIAKVGFHYYLAYSRRGFRGNEHIFASVRDFIINGGESEQFVRDHPIKFGSSISQWLDKNVGSIRNCHLLGIEDDTSSISVFVKMFHGADHSIAYRVQLAYPLTGWTSKARHAHVLVYDQSQPEFGFAGEMHELPTG